MSRVCDRGAARMASMLMILALSVCAKRALTPEQNTRVVMLLCNTRSVARLDTLVSRFRIDGVKTLACDCVVADCFRTFDFHTRR